MTSICTGCCDGTGSVSGVLRLGAGQEGLGDKVVKVKNRAEGMGVLTEDDLVLLKLAALYRALFEDLVPDESPANS